MCKAVRNAIIQMENAEKLLLESYGIEDLFEQGQSSYELSLSDYMFIVEAQRRDCLFFFLCQAQGLSASRIIEHDLNAEEPSVTIVLPDYDFALTIVCSSVDQLQRKAIIYTNVSDLPEGIKNLVLDEARETY